MKFFGKPKDYYDHQAYVWGVDEKIIYDRAPFWPAKPPLFEGGDPIYEDKKFVFTERLLLAYEVAGKPWRFYQFLAVCGRLYPLVDAAPDGKIYPTNYIWGQFETKPEMRLEIFREDHHTWVSEQNPPRWGRRWDEHQIYEWEKPLTQMKVGDELPALEWLSKEVHQPIFLITKMDTTGFYNNRGTCTFEVSPHYPVTADMGLGQMITPDKLYQEVGYWLTNIINPSPDVMPDGKPPQTDVEKVVAHGFDKKVSFRKRKVET